MTFETQSPVHPWIASPAAQVTWSEFFENSPVKAKRSRFTYSTVNDFGRKVHEYLLTAPCKGANSRFFHDMTSLATTLKFTVRASDPTLTLPVSVEAPAIKLQYYAVRDAKLVSAKGDVLESTNSKNTNEAVKRSCQRALLFKNHSAALSAHPFFKNKSVGRVAAVKLHQKCHEGLQTKPRKSRLYYEGGNVLHLTNQEGKPYYIIGEDLLTVTHLTLRKDGWFHAPDPDKPTVALASELSFKDGSPINTAPQYSELLHKDSSSINKLYLAGTIPIIINALAKSISPDTTDKEILTTLLEMRVMQILTAVKLTAEEDKKKGREIAISYLAQRSFVRASIFPAELGCTLHDILHVPQVAPHLGLMMAPGPKGSIFVQDFALTEKVLAYIKKYGREIFGITGFDLGVLDIAILLSRTIGKELFPLFSQLKEQLKSAGFAVIPAPGVFFGTNNTGEPGGLNFLNCLTGYSSGIGCYYYIAAGADFGKRLGRVLMDMYTEFLHSHCNDLNVYFVGKGQETEDYSEAFRTLRVSDAGPHCLGYELKIAPHTENGEDKELKSGESKK